MSISNLSKAVRAVGDGRIGDAGAYKALLLGAKARPGLARALSTLADPLPAIDLQKLRALPPGTFGYVYADHMDRCGLTPLVFSDACRNDLRGAPVLAPRYTLFHDVFHVLLDYDTSLRGECAVWSFVAAQRYSATFDSAGLTSLVAYSLIRPWRVGAFLRAYRDGRARGQRAGCVIAVPLERLWDKPLADVRRDLHLD